MPDAQPKTQGLADEQLARRAEERGRKRDAADGGGSDVDVERSRKRSRSASTHSSSSVSTISTRHSQSPSPPPRRDPSPSPNRSRNRKRKKSESSFDRSPSPRDHIEEDRVRSGGRDEERRTRRRRKSYSPNERGRRYDEGRRGSWRTRSRSQSMDKSRIAKERRSLTPESSGMNEYEARRQDRVASNDGKRHSRNSPQREPHRHKRGDNDGTPPQRDRSLSPYSKRLALTQAMNAGH